MKVGTYHCDDRPGFLSAGGVRLLGDLHAPRGTAHPNVPFQQYILDNFLRYSGHSSLVYYASAIIWPEQVALLYGDSKLIKVGLISVIPGLCNVGGKIVGGIFVNLIGHHEWQLTAVFFQGGVSLGCTFLPGTRMSDME